MSTRFDNWLSYNPDLEYENDNPHDYTITFRTKHMLLSVHVELENPTDDMDDNYTEAKQLALFHLEERYGMDPQALMFEVTETLAEVRK